ncbi:MAG: hypothetical protein JNK79_20530 [Chitinophagaceae bacterium]|nr:hypothetical protein [Chitinophagaceae bacterium]
MIFLSFSVFIVQGCSENKIPAELRSYISNINIENLGGQNATVKYETVSNNLVKVSVAFDFRDSVRQDDWKLSITPAFQPTFNWAPHLTPTDDHIIAQHLFRAPAMIAATPEKQLTIIPDLDLLATKPEVDWYMDMNAQKNQLTLGMSLSDVKEHVGFIRRSGGVYPPGRNEFGFYIMTESDKKALSDPWRNVLAFSWNKWGKKEYEASKESNPRDMEPFVKHTYNWAFNTWKNVVWQEFKINGRTVGAPQFIVNVTQSPNYKGEVDEREFRSIWNQAWFCSLRSAQGVYRYARKTNNKALMNYALKTKELALAFPQNKGFFPSVAGTEMHEIEINGKKYNRSKGWNTLYFGNSDRNPYENMSQNSPLHIADMSFTAYEMLLWYDDLEKDERLLKYAKDYADGLMQLQDGKGFFPAWLDYKTLEPKALLKESPETSMSVTFLLKLYDITKDEKYKASALKAMKAVMQYNVPIGQWEDFETYWSCNRYGSDSLPGKKVERNNMFKQNNFSMYWTAEALLNCYMQTKDSAYLEMGRRVLDEMLMCQATWQPPYMYVNVFGGFGVMNFDGEWNDARQSLFSALILDYGKLLNSEEYIQRGLAALRASFLMIYSPENVKTKKQWEARWDFFGPEDYGFMMENYGHSGVTDPNGVGIGEFTIYDWGNGAAAEAYNRMVDKYGKEFIENN